MFWESSINPSPHLPDGALPPKHPPVVWSRLGEQGTSSSGSKQCTNVSVKNKACASGSAGKSLLLIAGVGVGSSLETTEGESRGVVVREER